MLPDIFSPLTSRSRCARQEFLSVPRYPFRVFPPPFPLPKTLNGQRRHYMRVVSGPPRQYFFNDSSTIDHNNPQSFPRTPSSLLHTVEQDLKLLLPFSTSVAKPLENGGTPPRRLRFFLLSALFRKTLPTWTNDIAGPPSNFPAFLFPRQV